MDLIELATTVSALLGVVLVGLLAVVPAALDVDPHPLPPGHHAL